MITLANKDSINYKDELSKMIKIEIDLISASLVTQENLKKQVLIFLKSLLGNLEIKNSFSDTDNFCHFIDESSLSLKKLGFNVLSIKQLLDLLDNINSSFSFLAYESLAEQIKKYNSEYTTAINKLFINTTTVEHFIHEASFLDLSVFISPENFKSTIEPSKSTEDSKTIPAIAPSKNAEEPEVIPAVLPIVQAKEVAVEQTSTVAPTSCSTDTLPFPERTLIISELKEKVVLPYVLADLQNLLLLHSDLCHTLEDVINYFYTKPISYYKPSPMARFKEAYNLIIKKECGSKKTALGLATELFSNYNLHPAIITACKNLNELDVYLACLEYDELSDFHFFKIIYEVAPSVVKRQRNIHR